MKKINKVIKECKFRDKYNKDECIIEFNQFNSIFKEINEFPTKF